jgi:hypothetical protein
VRMRKKGILEMDDDNVTDKDEHYNGEKRK